MSYKRVIENWEELAKKDALWSILTDPAKKDNKWDEQEFFKTGKLEVETMLNYLIENKWLTKFGTALDFGCGVGRITRALCTRFEKSIGIDASETMIKKATDINKKYMNKVEFIANKKDNLNVIKDGSISFIYSVIVLQHLPKKQALNFIREFMNKLEHNGILVFQVPIEDIRNISLLKKLRENIKIGDKLADLGIRKNSQMEMNIQESDVIKTLIKNTGCELIDFKITNHTLPDFNGEIKFIEKNECVDFVSGLYVVRKL